MGKLSPKETAFCREYISLRNAYQAAIAAGYSKSTAHAKSASWLEKVGIKAEIARLQGKLEERTLITKERLIDEWARIAFADPGDVMTWNESGIEMIPKDKLAADKRRLIKSLSHHTTATGESFKVELVDRDSAKKELAKLLGYYPENGTGEAVTVVRIYNAAKERK